ncbi:unnamed protein product [Spirodela intermedia]|uniref:Uncharacterized protein n=1 Tax=Spirodela intermedia TaxID=51605 RepID=A0A7I8J2I5_SPIIN|nr:unnamed protein product [Spirodela intermedia]CAA6664424.1 unnamed protein product [Spirodela intermedia]
MASAAVRFLFVVAMCGVVALPSRVAGARPVSGAGFIVEGGVFCDTCQAGFETPASTNIAGAKVQVECRDRESGVVKYVADGSSDDQGKYRIYSVLVSSPDRWCSSPLAGRERARVVLTHHNGVVSDKRVANNLGFRSDSALAGCAEVMKAYQEYDD